MAVTVTGRPIVAGEKDRYILFTNIGLEWDDEGYTLKLRVVDESGNSTDYELDAVALQPEQAKLASTEDVFPTAGSYTLKLIAIDGSLDERILAENLLLDVKP